MCDTWQASNSDVYFAVTGHWIEERLPGKWTIENALLGFVQMNTAHNGTRLGQALFKVCNCLQIMAKVSTNKVPTYEMVLIDLVINVGRACHL